MRDVKMVGRCSGSGSKQVGPRIGTKKFTSSKVGQKDRRADEKRQEEEERGAPTRKRSVAGKN